jgi:hypothetical protein
MARHVSDEARSTPFMISLPHNLKLALTAAAAAANESVSGYIRKAVEARLASTPAPPVTLAPVPTAPEPSNNGLPPNVPSDVWLRLVDTTAVEPVPQSNAVDFVKAHTKPAMTRDQMREEMRLRDPEGYKLMQEEYEARLREALETPL